MKFRFFEDGGMSREILLRLYEYIRPYRFRLIGGLVCMIGVALCTISPPWLLKNVVDDVLIAKDRAMLNVLALALVFLFALKGLFGYGQKYLMNWVGQRVVMDIRTDLYAHIQTMSLRYIHGKRVGELLSRITNDTGVLQNAVSNVIVDLVIQGATCIGMLLFLLYINWKLTLLAFAIIPFILVIFKKASEKLRKVGHEMQEKIGELSALAEEALGAIRIVRACATEDMELERFKLRNMWNFKSLMRAAQVNAVLHGVVELALIVALAVILWFGGRYVIANTMTPGELVAFLGYIGFLASPMNSFTKALGQLQFSLAASERIFSLLDNDDRVVSPKDAVRLPCINGEVEFRDVWFAYEEGAWVFQGIDLLVKKGEKIAIVGSTGAGKSTLVDLVQRFYDVNSGVVLIDGNDLRSVDLKDLRTQIGVVPQEPILMKGSLKFNISYGYEATDEEVREAARTAGIADFIESLPLGYDTEVGVRGVTLSGGQRQRVAIARALVRDPKIIIMDEATSSLDAAVEHQIQQAMERAMEGRTSFIIAHRLSTIRNADRILFVENGKIVEDGSHEELMVLKGAYFKLFALQYGVS